MGWLVDSLVSWIEQAGTWLINELIVSIADAASYVLGILPGMPSLSFSVPSEVRTWFDFGAYYFPFSFFVAWVASLVVLWFAWLVLAIPLRWFKVVRGDQ